MSEHIEIEAKMLLSELEYNQIIDSLNLNKLPKIHQTNNYIDTPSLYFKKSKFSLRVREKDNELELTLKTHLKEGLLETNQIISKEEFNLFKNQGIFPIGEVKDILLNLSINLNELLIITSLSTERIEFIEDNNVISIDKNKYSGIIDYELEVESTSMENAKLVILDVLKRSSISKTEFNKISKQARAFNALRK